MQTEHIFHESWQLLEQELQQWEQPAALWWRDDDAVEDTPALRQLTSLQQLDHQPHLHLASIPMSLHQTLPALLRHSPNVWVLQHGYNHQSNALEGQRKVELGGDQTLDQLLEKLAAGRSVLQQAFEQRYIDIVVPPWNRYSSAAAEAIDTLGYKAISGLGPRGEQRSNTMLNVHVDIINWRTRSFVGTQACIQKIVDQLQLRRTSAVDASEPLGLMTHHLAHDQACWEFLQQWMIKTTSHPKIEWMQAEHALSR